MAASGPLDTAAASFSHPSTLDLVRHAASAGSCTTLHVVMAPEELSVIQVEVWAADGGNGVPGARISEPHRRLRDRATQAIAHVDTATFFDSTRRSEPHTAALFVNRFALSTGDADVADVGTGGAAGGGPHGTACEPRRARRRTCRDRVKGAGYLGKPRPAVIVQDDRLDTDSVTVCPCTADPTEAPLLRLAIEPTETTGVHEPCRIMVDKITTVHRSKLGRRIGALDDTDLVRLKRAIVTVLGIASSN